MEIATTLLAILGWSVFVLTILFSLALSLFGLFGAWIILAAVVIAWVVTGFSYFSVAGIAILAVCAVLGEVLETVAAGYGAARFGGGRGAMVAAVAGAIGGAILGAPFLLIIGALIGACVGAFAAVMLYEIIVMEREMGAAAYTGFGAALGKVAGMLAKFIISLIMVLVIVLDMFVF